MDLQEQLERRLKARRQILFSKEDACIRELQQLLDGRSRQVTVSWALDLAEETAAHLAEKYPEDPRAEEAVAMARLWAMGEIKMPAAKRAILACHAAAKEISSPEDIAHYHAVGQACGTVHANGHAIGYPIYDLTALIRKDGIEDCDASVARRMAHYLDRLNYWEGTCAREPGQWADFLLK